MKRTACIIMALLTALVFCACGGSYEAKQDYATVTTSSPAMAGSNAYYDSSYSGYNSDEIAEEPSAVQIDENQAQAATDRKIIKNYSVSVQTLEYDKAIETLTQMIAGSSGYIESSSHNGQGAIDYGRRYARSANYTLRVPAGESDSFVASLTSLGAVTNSNQGIEDVTDYYYDIDAHLSALSAQETRLLELLAQADSVDTMITIEDALADVRYQIESLQGTMRRLDNRIAYSTVRLSIEEVFKPEDIQVSPMTLGERITSRFQDSIETLREDGEDFLVWLIGDSLIILTWLLVVALLVFIWKKFIKKLFKGSLFKRRPGRKSKAEAEAAAAGEPAEKPEDKKE